MLWQWSPRFKLQGLLSRFAHIAGCWLGAGHREALMWFSSSAIRYIIPTLEHHIFINPSHPTTQEIWMNGTSSVEQLRPWQWWKLVDGLKILMNLISRLVSRLLSLDPQLWKDSDPIVTKIMDKHSSECYLMWILLLHSKHFFYNISQHPLSVSLASFFGVIRIGQQNYLPDVTDVLRVRQESGHYGTRSPCCECLATPFFWRNIYIFGWINMFDVGSG